MLNMKKTKVKTINIAEKIILNLLGLKNSLITFLFIFPSFDS